MNTGEQLQSILDNAVNAVDELESGYEVVMVIYHPETDSKIIAGSSECGHRNGNALVEAGEHLLDEIEVETVH